MCFTMVRKRGWGSSMESSLVKSTMDTELGLDSLIDIKEQLYPARTKWEDIGLKFKVDIETIQSIKQVCNEEHDRCLQNVITKRLQAIGPLTWRELCNCLRSPIVDRNDVAVKIEHWVKEKTFDPASQDDKLGPSRKRKRSLSSEGDFLSRDQDSDLAVFKEEKKRRAICPFILKRQFTNIWVSELSDSEGEARLRKLFFESSELSCKFMKLYSCLYLSLNKNVPVQHLVACLIGLEAFPPVYKSPSLPLFKDQLPSLCTALNLMEVWVLLKPYCSFFNFYIVDYIIDCLGSDNDKQNMTSYKKAFSLYIERRVFECPAEFGSLNDSDCTIIVKLDKSYDDCTLEQLTIFENKLCNILNISANGVLRLCTVEKGCYELTFQAPSFVKDTVFPLSREQEAALKDLKVVWLLCGDYEFSLSKMNQESDNSHDSDNSQDSDDDDDDNDGDDDHSSAFSRIINQLERIHGNAVMKPAEKPSDHVPSDSGLGFDDMSISISEFTEDTFDHEWPPSKSTVLPKDDCKTQIDLTGLIVAAYNGELAKVKFCIEVLHCDPLQHDSNGNSALQAAAHSGQLEVLKYIRSFVEDEMHSSIAHPNSSSTVLHIAALNGHFEMVKYLVEKVKLDPLLADTNQRTPLHNACRNGAIQIVEYLMDQARLQDLTDTIVCHRTTTGTTLLHLAAASGNCRLVEHTVSILKVDPDARGQFGATALLVAAQEGHLNIVEYLTGLINCSVTVTIQNTGHNALHIATKKGHLKIVKFLTANNLIDHNVKDHAGVTSLHLAAQYGFLNIVRYLIQTCKCNPLCLTAKRKAPLHFAAMGGNLDVIEYFLDEIKIDPLLRNVSHITPLHFAVQTGRTNVVDYYLNTIGCKLSTPDRLGEKLLLKAVQHGQLSVTKKLLMHQDWTKSKVGFRQTQLLTCAVQKGHLPILKYLTNECHWQYEKVYFLKRALLCGHLSIVRFLISYIDNKKFFLLHLACYGGHKHIVKFLIEECGKDPSQLDSNRISPLHYAAFSGQCDVVRYLFEEYRVDLYCGLKRVGTPLHSAVSARRLNIVQYFVDELKVDANVTDFMGYNPLHYACSHGDTDIIQFFIEDKNCNISARTTEGTSPLMFAVLNGHLKAVDLMVKTKRCNLLMKAYNKNNILHIAAQEGHLDIVKYIISETLIDKDIEGYKGKTALSTACYHGHIDIVKYLTIICKCSLQPDSNSVSPLHLAAASGHLQIVKFLINDLHCDVSQVDNQGATAFHVAVASGQLKVAEFFIKDLNCNILYKEEFSPLYLYLLNSTAAKVDDVKYLIDVLGYDFKIILKDGSNVLHLAAKAGHTKIFKYLTSLFGKNQSQAISAINKKSLAPIHIACSNGHIEIVRFLILDCKCSTHPVDGVTLLHRAVAAGQIEVVKFLINDLGWNSFSVDKNGVTLLHYSIGGGNIEMSRFLVKDLNFDPNARNLTGATPLMSYITDRHLSFNTLKIFVNELKCDPTVGEVDGRNILHFSARVGNLEVIEFLVSKFVDIHVDIIPFDDNQVTPLHEAALAGHLSIVKFLTFHMHCNPLCSDKYGATPLHHAMLSGKIKIFTFFIKELKCNPNVQDADGETPLWYFLRDCKVDHRNVEYLVNQLKCDPTVSRKDGSCVLHLMAQQGDLNKFKVLASKFPTNFLSPNHANVTPLHFACNFKQLKVVEFLCKGKSNISEVIDCDRGWSPLHYAVGGGSLCVVKFLVRKKSHDLFCFDKNGIAPFHLATKLGYLDIVQWFFSDLLIDPNIPTKNVLEYTPLHFACYIGSEELVKYFISLPTCDNLTKTLGKGLHIAAKRGNSKVIELLSYLDNCDLLCKSSDGHTALWIAVDNGYFDCTVVLVSAFKNKGINFNCPDEYGDTILHSACYTNNLKIIGYLLHEIKQDFLRITDNQGKIPLFAAVHENNIEIVDYLLKRYPQSVNSKDIDGNTVLHIAAFDGYESMVKSLILNYSMDPSLQNNHGTTALHLVCENGNKPLVTFLLSINDQLIGISDGNKQLPLHIAALKGHLFIIKTLVSNKNFDQESLFSVDIKGHTPCHLAAYEGFVHIVDYIFSYCKQKQLSQLLQHQRSIVQSMTIAHMSGRVCTEALIAHRAAENRYISALEYFFSEKLHDPNCRDSLQRTPLHYAAMTYKNEKCMQFLLDAGSSLMAEDVFHNHALHYAVALGHMDNVTHLIVKYGECDPLKFKGVLGMNVLDIAKSGGHHSMFNNI